VCSDGQIVKRSGGVWVCSNEASASSTPPYWVDNGMAISSNSSIEAGNVNVSGNLAFSGQLLPNGVACADNQVVKRSGSSWICSDEASAPASAHYWVDNGMTISSNSSVRGGSVNVSGSLMFYGQLLPNGVACADNQVVKRSGSVWVCSDLVSSNSSISPYWVENTFTISSNSSVKGGNVSVSGNLEFYGELMPDGTVCGNDQVVKRVGGAWVCSDAVAPSAYYWVENGYVISSNASNRGGNVSVSGNLEFYGELMPDGSICSDNQIVKRSGGTWICSDEMTASGSSEPLFGYTPLNIFSNSSFGRGNVNVTGNLTVAGTIKSGPMTVNSSQLTLDSGMAINGPIHGLINMIFAPALWSGDYVCGNISRIVSEWTYVCTGCVDINNNLVPCTDTAYEKWCACRVN